MSHQHMTQEEIHAIFVNIDRMLEKIRFVQIAHAEDMMDTGSFNDAVLAIAHTSGMLPRLLKEVMLLRIEKEALINSLASMGALTSEQILHIIDSASSTFDENPESPEK